MKNHQTVSKQQVNLFTAHALPRESGAYLALNEQLFIGIFIKWLQSIKNRQTVSKQQVNLFTAHALPRESGAYLAQAERIVISIRAGSIFNL